MMINISKRLMAIINLLDKNSRILDVGTDHGFVPNFIVNNSLSDFVICSDISKNSLKKSMDLVKFYKNEEYIQGRIGNGLNIIKENEVDEVIIAGMGGILISNIINENLKISKKIKKFILQPMQGQDKLRKYLYENGFKIFDEKIIYEDKKYFEIIVAKYVGEKFDLKDDIFLKIPKILFENKDIIMKDYLKYKINHNLEIMNFVKSDKMSTRSIDRLNELKIENKRFEEMLNEL